jgi:hypothetical protein
MAACSSSGTGSPPTASAAAQPSSKYPNAIAVLGHSGATGFDSDPAHPGEDTTANSWATGDNPSTSRPSWNGVCSASHSDHDVMVRTPSSKPA